jgi:hypothetical protein
MSTATIVLEDHDGQIACQLTFSPAGFDPSSHAHQHAHILISHMDSLCTKAPMPEQVIKEPAPRIVISEV